jgi:phosphoserine/homoserine phosphotransferase
MHVVCLDLEGVLVPEIWIGLAEKTGIESLRATTRDVPDYEQLMRRRLDLLNAHGLGFAELRQAAGSFYELAGTLMRKLGWPTLFCHRLEVDHNGRIAGYRLRQARPKQAAVRALRSLNFQVLAVGDSYNDLDMLAEADAGILFRPPANVVRAAPDYPVTQDYDALKAALVNAGRSIGS